MKLLPIEAVTFMSDQTFCGNVRQAISVPKLGAPVKPGKERDAKQWQIDWSPGLNMLRVVFVPMVAGKQPEVSYIPGAQIRSMRFQADPAEEDRPQKDMRPVEKAKEPEAPAKAGK